MSISESDHDKDKDRRRWLSSLALGQGISLLITGTGIFSTILADNAHADIPTTQSSINYVLLCLHLIVAVPVARREGLAAPWWVYALWAVADVEANWCVVQAYQYTSIASIALLDCFAIPVAMLLSRMVLGARYTGGHIAACCVCLVGLVLTVISDNIQSDGQSTEASHEWLGDILVLIGASLYGVSNVTQEWLLKGRGRRCETLGMLGFFGTVVSLVQVLLTERQALAQVQWSLTAWLALFGFQLSLFSMYTLTSFFLLSGDAALFNLSLLTSDFYSVMYAWFAQHHPPTWVYGAAFVTTISGLIVYHTRPEPTRGCALAPFEQLIVPVIEQPIC